MNYVYVAYDDNGVQICSVRDVPECADQFRAFDAELCNLLQSEYFSEQPEPDQHNPRGQVFVRDMPATLEFGECSMCRYSGDLCHECGCCADCCHSGGECGRHPVNPDRAFIPLFKGTAAQLRKQLEANGYIRARR